MQLSLVEFFSGNSSSALSHAQAACRPGAGSSVEGFGVGTLFRQLAYRGNRNDALALLDRDRALLPRAGQANTTGSWFMLALVIEGLFILGEWSQAADLYPMVVELLDTGCVALWPIFRFTQTIAGVAAAAARQWAVAEDYFRTAMQRAEAVPQRLEQAEKRKREMVRKREALERQIAEMRAALDAEEDEVSKIADHQNTRRASVASDRAAMARKRGRPRLPPPFLSLRA